MEGSCVLCCHEYISFHWIRRVEKMKGCIEFHAGILASWQGTSLQVRLVCLQDPALLIHSELSRIKPYKCGCHLTKCSWNQQVSKQTWCSRKCWFSRASEDLGFRSMKNRTLNLPFTDVTLVAKEYCLSLMSGSVLIFFTSLRSGFKDWDEDRMVAFWFITML